MVGGQTLGITEWAVVLELEMTSIGGELGFDQVETLVHALRPYRATALHNPDRYAMQLILDANGPLLALQRALVLHAEAVDETKLPIWEIVRTEVMTVPELERTWQVEGPTLTAADGAG